MDKLTLDFENDLMILETDIQSGTHHLPNLSVLKPQILSALGYEQFNLASVVVAFEQYISGQISEEELNKRLEKEF